MNLKKKTKILLPFIVLSLALTGFLFYYEVPEPVWNDHKVAENTAGKFVDIETTDSAVHVAFMNSSSGGVVKYSASEEGTLDRAVRTLAKGRKWEKEAVATEPGSGRYLSMDSNDEEVMLAYQDSTLGSEEVVVADKEEELWRKRQVTGVADGGINVGMYTSIEIFNSEPLVAYHSPESGLTAAMHRNGEWEKKNLGSQAGWFTSSASCQNRAVLAYSGRDSTELRTARFDEGWNTSSLGRDAQSGTSIAMDGCKPVYAYTNPESGSIEVLKDGKLNSVTGSQLSRLSIIKDRKYHVSYHDYGDGLYYGKSENLEDWNTTEIGSSSNDGEYNDIAIDQAGNIHVAYERGGDIHVAENNRGTLGIVRDSMSLLRAVSTSILSSLFFLALLIQLPVRKSLENLSYDRIQILLERLERIFEHEKQEKEVEFK